MKKLAVLLLSAAILLSAAACSGNDDVTTSPDSKPASTDTSTVTDAVTDSETEADINAVTDEATEAVTDVVTDAETEAETDAVAEESDVTGSQAFERGKVTGNTYESKFIGIGLALKDDWTVLTDKEMLEAAGLGSDITGIDVEQMIKDGKAAYDFGAKHSDGSTNIFVSFEKSTAFVVALADLNTVYDNSAAAIKQMYQGMGFTSFDFEKNTVEISGEEHIVLNCTAGANGVYMYQSMILFKAHDYFASVTLTTLDKNYIDSFYGSLYLLSETI